MITVFYRKENGWKHPQLKFNGDEYRDYVITPDCIESHKATLKFNELGLTQTVLANGYDNRSIWDVQIITAKRQ